VLLAVLVGEFGLVDKAYGLSINYVIEEIGTGGAPSTDTYTGTGFVGMHQDRFYDAFMFEFDYWSRTALQVDITALAGSSIINASLDFILNDGTPDAADV
jgi:hypothetical protein